MKKVPLQIFSNNGPSSLFRLRFACRIVYHIAQGIHPLVQHRPHRTCAAVDLAEGERHPVAGPAEGLDGPLAAAGGIGGAARARCRRVHVAADYLLVCES